MSKNAKNKSISAEQTAAEFDIIVIGSGPAGCAAAINAVNLGLSVLMLTKDRHFKPHAKFVTESLHPGSISVIEHLDALSVIEFAQTGSFRSIKTAENSDILLYDDGRSDQRSVIKKKGIPYVENLATGVHVNRDKFNYAFIEVAKSKVNRFCAGTTVIDLVQEAGTFTGVRTDNGVLYSSRFVVDASGSKRFSGSLLKLKVDYYSPPLICAAGRINKSSPAFQGISPGTVQFRSGACGWTWIAMEDHGQCYYTTSAIKKSDRKEFPSRIDGLGHLEQLRKRSLRWRSYRTTAMPGLILCGDAGFVIDPATGEGMLNAMYSGIRASETIFKCILEPEDCMSQLHAYDQDFNDMVVKKVRHVTSFYNALGIEF